MCLAITVVLPVPVHDCIVMVVCCDEGFVIEELGYKSIIA
jgi:hypothetical protein